MEEGKFVDIDHPVLDIPWLKAALDRFFAVAGGKVEQVGFLLGMNYYYDDNDNYTPTGDVYFTPVDGLPEKERLTEEDKDEIPAVRLMERKAVTLWSYHIPIEHDGEGAIPGEFEMMARAGYLGISYKNEDSDEPFWIEVSATWNGEGWDNVSKIVLTLNDDVSQTDLILRDDLAMTTLFGEISKPLPFTELPKVLSMEVDDDIVIFHVSHDAFMHWNSSYEE